MPSGKKILKAAAVLLALTLATAFVIFKHTQAAPQYDQDPNHPDPHQKFLQETCRPQFWFYPNQPPQAPPQLIIEPSDYEFDEASYTYKLRRPRRIQFWVSFNQLRPKSQRDADRRAALAPFRQPWPNEVTGRFAHLTGSKSGKVFDSDDVMTRFLLILDRRPTTDEPRPLPPSLLNPVKPSGFHTSKSGKIITPEWFLLQFNDRKWSHTDTPPYDPQAHAPYRRRKTPIDPLPWIIDAKPFSPQDLTIKLQLPVSSEANLPKPPSDPQPWSTPFFLNLTPRARPVPSP